MRQKLSPAAFVLSLLLAACANAQEVASLSEAGAPSGVQQRGVYGMERAANEYGVWGGGSFSGPTLIGKTEQTRLGIIGLRYARVLARGDNLTLRYTLDAVPVAVLSYPVTELIETPPPFGFVERRTRRNITGAGLSPAILQD